MRTDMPAEIWLDPYRWEALQEILEQDGTDIEEVLQNYLIEVYSDRVPIERQKEVDRRIKKERLAAVQEAEGFLCDAHPGTRAGVHPHGEKWPGVSPSSRVPAALSEKRIYHPPQRVRPGI